MFAKLTRTVVAVAVFGSLAALAAPASAQQVRYRPYVQPRVNPHVQPASPRLGFYGQMQYGWGMQVVSVTPGSLAGRNGLESGDVIVEINGRSIRCDADYHGALSDAAYQGGHVRLLVDNVRARNGFGQRYVYVSFYLDNGSGPILYRSSRP